MSMTDRMEQLASESQWDFSDLRALFINCTLKKSPELSHTQGLMDIAIDIMEKNGVAVENAARRRPRPRDRRLAGHDRARWDTRRLARALREGQGRRHPRARLGDLAGREDLGVHPRHRAFVRQLVAPQRRRASTPTTARSAVASSPATRTVPSTPPMNILYSLQHLGYDDPAPGRRRLAG